MIAHRSIVSLGFKSFALLVGGPAALAFAVLTAIAIGFRWTLPRRTART